MNTLISLRRKTRRACSAIELNEGKKSLLRRTNSVRIRNSAPICSFNRPRSMPGSSLLVQFYYLKQMFPDFPSGMILNLLFREDGNAKQVYKFLTNNGWKSQLPSSVPLLVDSPSALFTTKYYWGIFSESFMDILKQSPKGSFFTAVNDDGHFLLCFRISEQVLRKPIIAPNVSPESLELYSLNNPLSRPSSIKAAKLVPQLFQKLN